VSERDLGKRIFKLAKSSDGKRRKGNVLSLEARSPKWTAICLFHEKCVNV